jgi:hypothetical protein
MTDGNPVSIRHLRYAGAWEMGNMHGHGTMTSSDGGIDFSGLWEGDQPIES